MKVWSWAAMVALPVSLILGLFHWGDKSVPPRGVAPMRVARLNPAAVASTPTPLPKATWRVSTTKSPIDGIETTYLSQGDQTSGGVVLGCKGNRVDVYLGSRNQQAFDGVNYQAVEVKFGDKPAFTQTWTISQTSDGLFASAPLLLVGSLIKQKSVAIAYRVNGRAETDVFEADDLELQLQKNCPAYAASIRRVEKAAQLKASVENTGSDNQSDNQSHDRSDDLPADAGAGSDPPIRQPQ